MIKKVNQAEFELFDQQCMLNLICGIPINYGARFFDHFSSVYAEIVSQESDHSARLMLDIIYAESDPLRARQYIMAYVEKDPFDDHPGSPEI